MGRWAQYRTRGRGLGSAPAFPLEPPAWGEDWKAYDKTSELDLSVEVLVACPGSADGMFSQWKSELVDPDNDGENPTCGDVTAIATSIADGPYYVRVRWQQDGATPLSEWSEWHLSEAWP